jgi:hypothetical protein
VPPFNAISIQEDGDELTGGMAKGSFVYFLERQHIYRFTFQTDPGNDGFVFRSASRGCVNNRCWVNVDETCYMLDIGGIHAFKGGYEIEPISTPIQDLFRPGDSPFLVNWDAAAFFHACHFPMQEVIRWYVALTGFYLPFHAIAFDYRKQRWWLEQYNRPVGASTHANIRTNYPYLGLDAKKVCALWYGTLDGPNPANGTVRGTVTSAGVLSLTDSNATYPAFGLVGHSIAIVDGTGVGQVRLISSVTGQTLNLTEPWNIQPDTTSVYQLGGIFYDFKTGAFRFIQNEETEQRRIEAVIQPTKQPALCRFNVFYNRLPSPEVWTALYNNQAGNQLSSKPNSPDLVADLTKSIGFFQKQISTHKEHYADGVRFMEVELFGYSNADPIVINFLSLDGVAK